MDDNDDVKWLNDEEKIKEGNVNRGRHTIYLFLIENYVEKGMLLCARTLT